MTTTLEEFEAIYAMVDNQGAWGPDDERGTLNLISEDHIVAATALVRLGKSVSMARTIGTAAAADNPRPALHYMSKLASLQRVEPSGNYDFVGFEFHGWTMTHIDALCHTAYKGRLYNGVETGDAVDAESGASVQSILAMKDGIVGRGVFLDIARSEGVEWLEPGTEITAAMLEKAEKAANVSVSEGDIVVYRSGAPLRRKREGPWDLATGTAGLHVDCMLWLHERRIGALCSDGAHDVRPEVMEEIESPIHALAIPAMGLCTIDAMDLEELSAVCEREQRWEFLFMSAPLLFEGGTGSPANPIAVF